MDHLEGVFFISDHVVYFVLRVGSAIEHGLGNVNDISFEKVPDMHVVSSPVGLQRLGVDQGKSTSGFGDALIVSAHEFELVKNN
jgi:hypothetical protein